MPRVDTWGEQEGCMFGLVVRFKLKRGSGPDFDKLTDKTVTGIRAAEPGTLIYACHQVEDDPDARVFYELYRDRSAFDAHEQQPHVRRFLAKREQYMAAAPRVELMRLRAGAGVPSDAIQSS
jgi:quinol monooxygenase YgiN